MMRELYLPKMTLADPVPDSEDEEYLFRSKVRSFTLASTFSTYRSS